MLKINQVSIKYQDGKQALNQISLQVNEGETVGIIGANGAGKSTLFKAIVGIMLPEVGSIDVDGLFVTKKDLQNIRQKVGVVFQHPEDQLFLSNVYDDIAFGLRNQGMDDKEIEVKTANILKVFQIEHLRDKNSSKLSGGEQRLVAIATVMVMEPLIMLFDEPTSFLDPKARRSLMNEIKKIPVTKLIATHDLDMAFELCDRIIILKDGKIFDEGVAKVLLSNADIMEKAGLELPLCLQRMG